MPKVLYVTDYLGIGGKERQLALLAKHLPAEWERQVWSLDGGPFADVIRAGGTPLHVHRRTWRWDALAALDVWQLIAGWRPDVVHSWGWMSSLAAGVTCKILNIPFVDGTIRTGMAIRRFGGASGLGLRLAGRVVANSQAGLAAWSIGPEKGRVVYNGFEPQRFSLCERSTARSAGPTTAVMAARMYPEKDFRTFLAAAREMSQSTGEEWRFLAIGDGPEREALISECNDLASRGMVGLATPRLEVLGLVRDCDIGVLLSPPGVDYEGCSNSIMEYMACGLPVVCSDAGGNRELVIDGKTGFLVTPGDWRAVAEKLTWLRDHPREAKRMGDAGRERILGEFSAAKMVSGFISVYEELL